jgi:bifunctional NMN adenylyltransferase/nudix hydrolase
MSQLESKPYDLAVVIGRFQLPHVGHALLLNKALEVARHVLVIKGSSHQPRTIKNPFTYHELAVALGRYMESVGGTHRYTIVGSTDHPYSDTAWLKQTQTVISNTARGVVHKPFSDVEPSCNPPAKVCIVGYKKDDSTYYLDLFPQFDFVAVNEFKLGLDSTTLRNILYERPDVLKIGKQLILPTMYPFLDSFISKEEYKTLVKEYEYYKQYRIDWGDGPFLTADAVIVKSGHILLVRRGEFPGKGLWALPGGFVNPKERMFDAAIREAYEETNIDVPPGLLRGSLVKKEIFDHPDRSIRGRIVTLACLFKLDGHDKKPGLPKTRAADDAKETQWFSISDFMKMSDIVFEDHQGIVTNLLGLEQ